MTATHYQLSIPRTGAGRPSWFPEEPVPIDQDVEVDEAEYNLRLLRQRLGSTVDQSFDQRWETLHRVARLKLLWPSASTSAIPPVPVRPIAAEPGPVDAVRQLVDTSVQLVNLGADLKMRSNADLRGERESLSQQLERERQYNAVLLQRNEDLVNRNLTLAEKVMVLMDLLGEKWKELGERMATIPGPPGEAPYVAIFNRLATTLDNAVNNFAPGVNAKLGAVIREVTKATTNPAPLPAGPAGGAAPPIAEENPKQPATSKDVAPSDDDGEEEDEDEDDEQPGEVITTGPKGLDMKSVWGQLSDEQRQEMARSAEEWRALQDKQP